MAGDADGNDLLPGSPEAAADAVLAEGLDLQTAMAVGDRFLDPLLQDAGAHALPVLLAVGIAVAPPQVTQRFYSRFSLKDPTSRDRVGMMREGVRMIAADPLTGMGPNMVERQYVRFRDPDAVERVNPHLHNVPMQIAAERGLPALGAWLWFVSSVVAGLWGLLRTGRHRFLAACGLGAVAAMLGAGLFEHKRN